MAELILTLKTDLRTPLDAEAISPDNFTGRSISEILAFEAWRGNRRVQLREVFDISGEAGGTTSDLTITLNGNLSKVKRVGRRMSTGKIVINGSVGMYVGEEMKGGSILIHGNAGSLAGIGMKGGVIEVDGDAGDAIGSGYRGGRSGMEGGVILIRGNVGSEIGCWMKDGVIKVGGNASLFAGVRMQGGTILISGDSQGRLGASMTGGKVVILGSVPSILPSFLIDEIRPNTKVGEEKVAGPFYTFTGDVIEGGNGKLFVSIGKNPHLKVKEEFIL